MSKPKLTPEQIAAGWIEIESEEQLRQLPDGFYSLACNVQDDYLCVKRGSRWALAYSFFTDDTLGHSFIAYRPLPSYEEHEKLKKKCESCTRMLGAWQHKTLRDEIAIAAMQVEIRNNPHYSADKAAACAYAQADAMLEAREKGDTNAE